VVVVVVVDVEVEEDVEVEVEVEVEVVEGGNVSGELEVDSGGVFAVVSEIDAAEVVLIVVISVVSEISSTEVLLIVVVTPGEVSATVRAEVNEVVSSLFIIALVIIEFCNLKKYGCSSPDWLVWLKIFVTNTGFSDVSGRVKF
jgi:hypothetical protein